MIQTVNLYTFRCAFGTSERDNFSYVGQQVLFDYLESYEEESGAQIEFNVVALCCEYSEDDYKTIAENYSIGLDTDGNVIDDQKELKEIVRDFLNDNTSVCGEVDGGFVYAIF